MPRVSCGSGGADTARHRQASDGDGLPLPLRAAARSICVSYVSAYAADLDDNRFDLFVAATSFHWADQSAGLPKLGRILRRGGWAALWWTIFDDPGREDAFREALRGRLGRDDVGGQVLRPFVTVMYTGRRPQQEDQQLQ